MAVHTTDVFDDTGRAETLGVTAKIVRRRKGGLQLRQTRRFSPELRIAFLDALASTCNVLKAAAHVGLDASSIYRHRIADPEFAEQWREALSIGYDRLETLVLEHSGAGGSVAWPASDSIEAPPPPFDFERAIRTLQQHSGRNRRAGSGAGSAAGSGASPRRGGRHSTDAIREETNAALVKALAAAAKRIAATKRPATGEPDDR